MKKSKNLRKSRESNLVKIGSTLFYGTVGGFTGSFVGGIEGFFSSFALPTNLRTLYFNIPDKLDEVLGESSKNKDYYDKVLKLSYYAVKYPTRVIGNIALVSTISENISQDRYAVPLFCLATNFASGLYEVYRGGQRSLIKTD